MLSLREEAAALQAALLDIERFVGQSGWDQPTRLFALVRTDDIVRDNPELARQLQLQGSADGAPAGALTSVEQDGFVAGEDLGRALSTIAWPDAVHGCAVCVERCFLPASASDELPHDDEAAAALVAEHPDRDELRLLSGAVRGDGAAVEFTLARVRSTDELVAGDNLAPGLSRAMAATLDSPTPSPEENDD